MKNKLINMLATLVVVASMGTPAYAQIRTVTARVPDNGITALLLGVTVIGLGLAARRARLTKK
jgi:hypothetical protein